MKAVKYAWIKERHNQRIFKVNAMCEMLGVIRSGYYAWKNNPQSARDKEDIRLGELIKNHLMKVVIPTAENESKMI